MNVKNKQVTVDYVQVASYIAHCTFLASLPDLALHFVYTVHLRQGCILQDEKRQNVSTMTTLIRKEEKAPTSVLDS